MTEQAVKPTYIGLWTKQDKNGNPYLNGSDDSKVYFIFRDKEDEAKKTLYTLNKGEQDAKLTKLGLLDKLTNTNGEFMKFDNICVFPNTGRDESKNQPHFNLVIYNDK